MREEYETIVASGLVLQIDDAWLPALWDRIGIAMGLDAFRRRCMRIDALNHALRNVKPETACAITCAGGAGTGRMPMTSR